MKRAQVIFAWSLFGLSIVYLTNALSIVRGTAASPGPGLFPLVVGAGLVSFSLAMAVRSSIQEGGGESSLPSGANARRVLGLLGSLAFYTAALPVLGHPISSCILFAFVSRVMGQRDVRKLLLGGLLAALISWYIFSAVLGLSIPLIPVIGI